MAAPSPASTGLPARAGGLRPPATRWAGLCLASAAIFLALSAAAAAGPLPGDVEIRAWLLAAATPDLVAAAGWVNHGGTWKVLLPAFVLLVALSPDARRRWWLWGAVLLLAPVVEGAWKLVVHRPRPEGTAPGFPSGHATAAATYALVVIRTTLAAPAAPAAPGVALAVVALAGAAAVGLARIVQNAHGPPDVVGGWALGTCCVTAAAWWDASPGAGGVSE